MLIHRLIMLVLGLGLIQLLPIAESTAETQTKAGQKTARIGFHFYKPGKIYEEAYQGIIDGLQLAGYELEKVIYRSERNKVKAAENLREMDSLNLGVIVSFSSAGTRIASTLSLKTPILASVINHPIILGIEKDTDATASNISGTSYYIDAEDQLALYLDLHNEASKVGMIYDKNNPAGYLAEEPMMRTACERRNIEFISIGATGRNDLELIAKQMLEHDVAFIVIPTNLQIYNNLDIVLKHTNPLKIPVFSMNKQGVEAGALAALYADTYKNGRQMIHLIDRIIINKEKAANIPFYYSDQPDLIINIKTAMDLDYEFKPTILGKASIVLN